MTSSIAVQLITAWIKSIKNRPKRTLPEINRSVSSIAENVKYVIFEEGTFGLKHRLKAPFTLEIFLLGVSTFT